MEESESELSEEDSSESALVRKVENEISDSTGHLRHKLDGKKKAPKKGKKNLNKRGVHNWDRIFHYLTQQYLKKKKKKKLFLWILFPSNMKK